MQFVNRAEELAVLRERLARPTAELLVVTGRRRVGKSALLAQLASDARSFYFEAPDSVAPDQLRDLTAELARVGGSGALTIQPLTGWEAALGAIAELAGDRRTLVVLDEYQRLAARSPELEQTIARWWRSTGRELPLVLVLAGSGPPSLAGCRTGQLEVRTLSPRDAALFHPGYGAEDRVRAYAVCGGVPAYLTCFTDERPLGEQLAGAVFAPAAALAGEAELQLRRLVPDPVHHVAVLRSIAQGYDREDDVRQRTGLAGREVARLLDAQVLLGLIERQQPLTARARRWRAAYAIGDHFLRFHHRFVEPFRSRLRSAEMAEAYVRESVLPQLDHHAAGAWRDVAREVVLGSAPGVTAVGRWWGPVPAGGWRRTEEREIDLLGVGADGRPVAVGACQWTADAMDVDRLEELDRTAAHVEGRTGSEERYLFSRAGFSERLRERAADDPRLHLVTPDDVYA